MADLDWRLILDAFADAVVATDGAQRIVYLNEAAERLLGWPVGDLVGQPLTAIIPPRLHALHRAGFQRYLATHVPTLIGRTVRVPALRRDGTEVDVELALAAFRLGGEADLIVASLRDLRERVELERQIAVTRYLRATTAAAAKLTGALDLAELLRIVVETVVSEFDAAAAEVWLYEAASGTLQLRAGAGAATAECRTDRIEVATNVSALAEAARTFRPLAQNERGDDPAFLPEAAEGERITALAVFPLVIAGELQGVLAHFSRQPLAAEVVEALGTFAAIVTAALNSVQLLAREQEARAEAQEANRAKDRFLAVLSHELRTPLSSIQASAELLHRTADDPHRVRRIARVVERNARLQANLVDDLLDLSRVTQGKLALDRRPVPLSELIGHTLDGLRAAAAAARLTLVWEPPAVEAQVEADPFRLQQVLLNLVSNAIKFTPPGGQVRLELTLSETGKARVVVADSGIGISPVALPLIFEMFHQEEEGQARRGLGIGLALVEALVRLHGGRVWAESAGLGHGSRFVVELPAVPTHQGLDEPKPGSRRPLPGLRASGSGPSPELLLVEDSKDSRETLAEVLALFGYRVREAESAAEALALLQEWRPDVILTDIGLPGMDGYELIRRVRQMPDQGGVIALAVTGYGTEEDQNKTRAAGFDAHLTKPVDLDILDRRLRELLSASGGGRSKA